MDVNSGLQIARQKRFYTGRRYSVKDLKESPDNCQLHRQSPFKKTERTSFFPGILLALLWLPIGLILCDACSGISLPETAAPTSIYPSAPACYTFRVINTFPHDSRAFTQGLVIEDGILYESTGLHGESSLRKVDLETGEILKLHKLPEEYFGEGLAAYRDTLVQLTWKSGKALVYDGESFKLLQEFNYSTEGWGLTYDGKNLVMSDGSPTLYFRDPETFRLLKTVRVQDNQTPVERINEMEYIEGKIFANIWQTDRIAIIEPGTGQVSAWVDLTGLLPAESVSSTVDVLNGIAYDKGKKRLFVTGKLWPLLFEIELIDCSS